MRSLFLYGEPAILTVDKMFVLKLSPEGSKVRRGSCNAVGQLHANECIFFTLY